MLIFVHKLNSRQKVSSTVLWYRPSRAWKAAWEKDLKNSVNVLQIPPSWGPLQKEWVICKCVHSAEEKFPTSRVWKELCLPMPGRLNGPFLLLLKVYEVEQTNCKGNYALSPQASLTKAWTHNGSFRHSATQTLIKHIRAPLRGLLKLTRALKLTYYVGRAPFYRTTFSSSR